MQEMCETISEHWRKTRGTEVSPEAIFNYSPTGELSEVFFWYWEATGTGPINENPEMKANLDRLAAAQDR
jgi:hypothetical protein